MSVWKEIRCDVNADDNCADHRNETPMGFDSAAALRKDGLRSGWRVVKDVGDVCPSCAKALKP